MFLPQPYRRRKNANSRFFPEFFQPRHIAKTIDAGLREAGRPVEDKGSSDGQRRPLSVGQSIVDDGRWLP